MATVDGVTTAPDENGIIQGNGGSVDKMAGGAGNDTLQGHAAFNQYYGGSGNDTFILSAKFGTTTKGAPTEDFSKLATYVTDFHGGSGPGEHDFIALSGFGASSELTLLDTSPSGSNGGKAVLLHYSIFDTHTGEYYNFMVNSLNGAKLGINDFAFYGTTSDAFTA